MANRDIELLVKLVTDTKGISQGVSDVNSKLSTFGRSLAGLGAGLGLAVGLNEAVDFLGDAVGKANDLAEAQNKVDVIFGDSADTVRTWASELDSGFRMSELQATSFVGTLGTLVKGMGLSSEATAQMSTDLAELGADLASFNNVSIEEALGAISSGLAGESEPLRRFGIDIRDAKVSADALADGLTGLSKEQQRVASITKQAGFLGVTGDALRTADSAVGQAEALRVEYENLQTELGKRLVPAQMLLTKALLATVSAFNAVMDAAARNDIAPVTPEDALAMQGYQASMEALARSVGLLSAEEALVQLKELGFEADTFKGRWELLQDAVQAGVFNSFIDESGRAEAAANLASLQIERMGLSVADTAEELSMLGQAVEPVHTIGEGIDWASDIAVFALRELSAEATNILGQDGSIRKTFDAFWKDQKADQARARYFFDPDAMRQEREDWRAAVAEWEEVGRKARKADNEGVARWAEDHLEELRKLGVDLGVSAKTLWNTYSREQQAALNGLMADVLAFAQDVKDAISGLFGSTWRPTGTGTGNGPGRSSRSSRGAAGNISITVNAMGDEYGIERAVLSALRRAGVANGGLRVSRIKGY